MKYLIYILVFFICSSCKQDKEEYEKLILDDNSTVHIDNLDGKKLMELHCYLCHGPNSQFKEEIFAPPMVAIKAKYINIEGFSKDEFVKYVAAFVKNPTEEIALMESDVKKHGLMSKLAMPEGSVEKIATYMFNYQIEEPNWFKADWESLGNGNWKQSGQKYIEVEVDKTYFDAGINYVLATKKVLNKNLTNQIQYNGVVAALDFCNLNAIHLTDSVAKKYKVSIKRVSDRYRNPNNKPNVEELKYFNHFKQVYKDNYDAKPVIVKSVNKINFYYPIELNTMCLQCHGKEIQPEVGKQILKLYPNDLAIGYEEGDLRGIWSITFDKKK